MSVMAGVVYLELKKLEEDTQSSLEDCINLMLGNLTNESNEVASAAANSLMVLAQNVKDLPYLKSVSSYSQFCFNV